MKSTLPTLGNEQRRGGLGRSLLVAKPTSPVLTTIMSEIGVSEIGEGSPVRPALLGKLIDAQNEHQEAFNAKYLSFIQTAGQAQKDCDSSILDCTVIAKIVPPEQQAADSQLNKTKGKDKGINNTFSKVFAFYATFCGENTSGLFDSLDADSNSWSHSELEIYLRDFMVIPKLLSREAMGVIWADMSLDAIKKTGKIMSQLVESDCSQILSRIAVYIYSQPGTCKSVG